MAAGAQWFLRTTSHCLPSKQVLGSAKADVGKSTWWQADEFAQVGPIGHEGTGRWVGLAFGASRFLCRIELGGSEPSMRKCALTAPTPKFSVRQVGIGQRRWPWWQPSLRAAKDDGFVCRLHRKSLRVRREYFRLTPSRTVTARVRIGVQRMIS